MIASIIYGGLIYLFIKIIKAVYQFWNVRKIPLKQMYGESTYCVIFGGSDGIGLSLAKEYAKEGLNLVLISRNMEKLNKAKVVLSEYKVNVLTYQMDMSLITKDNVDETIKNLDINLKNLNVSIMIYNVGVLQSKQFLDDSLENISNMFRVNCTVNTIMNRYFLERFKNLRKNKRSAIVTLGSCSTIKSFSSYSLYGATKSFQEFLNQTLELEDNNNIDFAIFKPAFVKTRERKSSTVRKLIEITPDECAKDLVKYMGKRTIIAGNYKHEILVFILENTPDFILDFLGY